MNLLKQSTAVILKAEFYDATDGVTPETALSIAQADIQISKNGGTYAQTSDASPTTTHDAGGSYPIPLTATDTGTLGQIRVKVVKTGALPWFATFMVVPAAVYDSLVLGTDVLPADVTQLNGDATAGSILALMTGTDETDTAQAGAAGTITLASGASATADAYNNWWCTITSGTGAGQRRFITDYDGGTKVASVSPNWATNPDATSVYVLTLGAPGPTTLVALQPVNVTAWNGALVATPSVAGVPEVDVTHVAGSAEDIATATQLTSVNANVTSVAADVVTIDAIVDAIKLVTDLLPNAGALTTLITHLTDIKGATFSGTTDSLEAIRDRGDAAWLTGAGGSAPTVAQIRAEMDSNSTQLASIVASLAGVLTANVTQIEGVATVDGESLIGWFRILGAFAAGDTTGFDSDSPTFGAMDGSKTRIGGTLDANKNRTISTLVGT